MRRYIFLCVLSGDNAVHYLNYVNNYLRRIGEFYLPIESTTIDEAHPVCVGSMMIFASILLRSTLYQSTRFEQEFPIR